MKVLKFGGTSVKDSSTITKVINLIAKEYQSTTNVIVVVSAFADVTEQLIEIMNCAGRKDKKYKTILLSLYKRHNKVIEELSISASNKFFFKQYRKLIKEIKNLTSSIFSLAENNKRIRDNIIGFGERFSSLIIEAAIAGKNIPSTHMQADKFIITNDRFGNAKVNFTLTKNLLVEACQNKDGVFVFGGFIASTKDNIPTTLGRGGSDYSASIIGWALGVKQIEIWTDVDGVMSADPRYVSSAFVIDYITYDEASELAHFGATVLHPKTMRPAKDAKIPLLIKNTFAPEKQGTIISNEIKNNDFDIIGLSVLRLICIINIKTKDVIPLSYVASKIYNCFYKADIDILFASQASYEQSLTIAIYNEDVESAKQQIDQVIKAEINNNIVKSFFSHNYVIIAIVGRQMKDKSGVAGKFFSILGENDINIVAIAQGASELNISVVLDNKNDLKALRLVHDIFFNLK